MKKKKWYKDPKFYGKAIASVGSILMLFSPHTTAYKVGAGITISTGFSLWFRESYKNNELPSGVTKVADKIPNLLTGKRETNVK